ncbi:formylmethanofuran dehydrogenase subunit C [Candidatus Bathyarchaeota archaeon]|nr:MAG: formylmethanofuran dehydrogenase subunit C [Candidatus Bathyarchaeota archaeon]
MLGVVAEVRLRPREPLRVPIYAPCIKPDAFAGLSEREIGALEVLRGNRKVRLADIFHVEGDASAKPEGLTIRLQGDFSKVRQVGFEMRSGRIIVEGDIGLLTGEHMRGGTIEIHGSAGSWLGARMLGGRIEVHGSAGDYVGSAYRGARDGMKDGCIIIHGNAGSELGNYMRGGTIEVQGSVGLFPGIHMQGGAILVHGDCEGRPGAFMRDGKLIICGHVPGVLPGFNILRISKSVKFGDRRVQGPFYTFVGDLTEGGDGRLHVAKAPNEHLAYLERLIGG